MVKQSVKNNNDNRNYTLKKLSNDLINLIDTKANFIVLEFTNSRIAQKYVDFLYKNKITVRLLASYGLPNFVRMTIGTKSDMKEAVRISNKFNV